MRRAVTILIVSLTAAFTARFAAAQGTLLYHGNVIDPQTEIMYAKGLNFLASSQNDAGYWSGTHGNEPGVVGLAVLAMLAHGDDPNYGPYSPSIKKGLNFIISQATAANGQIGMSMYNHGFATLALAEAYGAVDDARIGPALEKAVELILSSQSRNPKGAWRYSPENRDADTTVSGAQVVALVAARNAGLGVPDQAIEKALRFYKQCQSGDGGFGYTSASGSSPPRAAIGTLAFGLSRHKNSTSFRAGFRHLRQIPSEAGVNYFYYYLYYAAQAYFHADMTAWNEWNVRMTKLLRDRQNADGSWAGRHGHPFSTSAALLALALNYRYLPIYER
jgi:hypothetical protein